MQKLKRQIFYRMLMNKFTNILKQPKGVVSYVNDYLSRSIPKSRKNVIVSYPKSGRTWLEQLIIHVVIENYELKDSHVEHFNELIAKHNDIKIPYVLLTHAYSSWEDLYILDENEICKVDKQSQAGEKTLFLYRDPRDVLVSSYYHLRYRNGIHWISPSDMINNPIVGLHKIVRFMNEWLTYTLQNNNCMMLSFEEIKADSMKALNKVCEYFDIKSEEGAQKKAIEKCSFEAMQGKEKNNLFKSPRLKMIDSNQPESSKVRSGKVGSYLGFFSADEVKAINNIINAELDPFFDYHKKNDMNNLQEQNK